MQDSWILYRCVNKEVYLLNFRRSVVQYYSKRSTNLLDHPQNRISTKESSIDCGFQTPSGNTATCTSFKRHLGIKEDGAQVLDARQEFEQNVKSTIWVSASPAFPFLLALQ